MSDNLVTQESTTTPQGGETAGYGQRFLALLIDWVLCVMLSGFVADFPHTGLWVYPILIAEYAFFVGLGTQTPGMRVAGIRCVSVVNGGPIGVFRAAVRAVLLCLLVPVLLVDSYGRGWHDRVAQSIMLRA
mgnify:CR=1 FL=1